MYVLIVGVDYTLDPHGPFQDVDEAQRYARAYCEHHNIPGHENVVPTEDENDAWTDAGWTFHILRPHYENIGDF